jgi:DNA-binding transcriptional ArsR family regulator
MKSGSVSHRKVLTNNQLLVLRLTFKFRFVSSELIAKYLGKDRSTIYERLSILVKQGYLDKQYDGSYKLAGKPATYSLATKGIRTLLQDKDHNYSRAGLRNMYRNNMVTPEYMEHCLTVFSAFIALKQQYANKFSIYSKNELAGNDAFPKTKSDLYLEGKGSAARPHYMLDVFDNASDFMTRRKRLKALFAHEDSGDWENMYGAYPSYLFVVADDKIVPRLMKEVEYYYNRSYVDEEEITTHITTLDKLLGEEKKIWKLYVSDPDEDDVPVIKALK